MPIQPVMENERMLLIIDDELDACLLLKRVLKKRFPVITCAHTLEEGKAMAAANKPDVILLDNNLPDGYGIEHISKFKNFGYPVLLIMISAMDISQEALAAGADAFISKPADMLSLDLVN